MDELQKLIEAVEAGTATTMKFDDAMTGHDATTAETAYFGSLDAAKALHDALLGAETYGWGAGPWGARVWLFSDHSTWDGSVRQDVDLVNQPARAWLLAILRARAAQSEGEA